MIKTEDIKILYNLFLVMTALSFSFFIPMKAALDFNGQTFTDHDFATQYAANINALVGAKFDEAIITNCDFHGLNLARASFVGARIIGTAQNNNDGVVNFENCGLREVDFTDAILSVQGGVTTGGGAGPAATPFSLGGYGKINFKNADLTGALFKTAQFNATGGGGFTNSRHDDITGGVAIIEFNNANLTSSNWNGTTISCQKGIDGGGPGGLAKVDFTSANLERAIFNNATFNKDHGSLISMTNGDTQGDSPINFKYTDFSRAIGLDNITFYDDQAIPPQVSFDKTFFINTIIPIARELYTGIPITSEAGILVERKNSSVLPFIS